MITFLCATCGTEHRVVNCVHGQIADLRAEASRLRTALAESEARRAEAERQRDEEARGRSEALKGRWVARDGTNLDPVAMEHLLMLAHDGLKATRARAEAAERSLAAAVEVLRPFVDALDGLVFHRAEDGTTTVTGKAVDDFDAWRGFVDALIKVRALAAALAGGSHG